MFEVKSLAEKHDYPDLFTVRFAREKLYIGDTSYPIGQLSVDMLNVSKESMLKLKRLSESFAKTIDQKFFSPKEQHTRETVSYTHLDVYKRQEYTLSYFLIPL